MAVGDIFELKVVGSLHGQTVMNVLHYIVSLQPTIDPQITLGSWFGGTRMTQWLAVVSIDYQFLRTEVRKVEPAPPTEPTTDVTGAGPGGVNEASLPASNAVVITKRTGIPGRGFRGRVYVAGIPPTRVLNSQLTGLGTLDFQALANDLIVPNLENGGTLTLCLYKRAVGDGITILSAVARPVIRNQRRRQWGVGI